MELVSDDRPISDSRDRRPGRTDRTTAEPSEPLVEAIAEELFARFGPEIGWLRPRTLTASRS